MDRYFVLLGGGELKTKETLALDREIGELAKKRAGEKRANALFVGTASHDFMPYYNTFHKTYTGELDIKTDVALTVYTGSYHAPLLYEGRCITLLSGGKLHAVGF